MRDSREVGKKIESRKSLVLGNRNHGNVIPLTYFAACSRKESGPNDRQHATFQRE
ncbi:hypothetical protein E2C01_067577 [Portunus trituberculatus]|uniref:Uncharacterized protein n=1 Tax=Portunus trituberculatus TaxID=210409 RepID=A0A5B7HTZ1_PORTR|nr:hypothetical protein [Portunus trituberculatus]